MKARWWFTWCCNADSFHSAVKFSFCIISQSASLAGIFSNHILVLFYKLFSKSIFVFTHRKTQGTFTDCIFLIIVCFYDCVLSIYSAHVVNKVWDYSCLLSRITSFCLSPHGPHTAWSQRDERQWVIDAHRASTHLLCSSGGELRDAQPLSEVLGCGKLQSERGLETLQLSNAAFTRITSSRGLLFYSPLLPHQTALRRGLFTGKASRSAPPGFWLLWDLVFLVFMTPLAPVESKSDPHSIYAR